MTALERAMGAYVTGNKFWNREIEIEIFTGMIDEGANILMAGHRRIGKTSLMHEVASRIHEKYYCLHVDLQQSKSAADAITELSKATHSYKKLWSRTKDVFGKIFEKISENIETLGTEELSITLRGGLTGDAWKSKGDHLLSTLAETDKPVVIFFDEFPILINRLLKGEGYRITPEGRGATDVFMSWIRANTIRYKDKLRMVITGSIGIEPALKQAGLSSTLNTFAPYILPPWSRETAIGCLTALGNQYGISFQQEALDRIVDKLGYLVPHHVQLFFDTIFKDCTRHSRMEVTEKRIDEIYQTGMLGIQGHAELSHMEERLKTAFGLEMLPISLELLTEAAVTGFLDAESAFEIIHKHPIEKRTAGEVLREILDILQHDGYLSQTDDKFVFTSNLLKDWWNARFGFSYTAASTRRP